MSDTRSVFALLWRASCPYAWRRNSTMALSGLTAAVGTFIGPAIIAGFLGSLQQGTLTNQSAYWFIGLYTVTEFWSEVIGWRITIYLCSTLETAMQRDINQVVFKKLTNETLFFHSNTFGGSLVSQTNKLTGSLERFWDTIIWSIVPMSISIIGSIIILWFILWPFALILAVLSLVFVVAVAYFSRSIARLNETEAEASNVLSGHLADVISNILAVKASGAEAAETKSYEDDTKDWRAKSIRTTIGFLKASGTYTTITTLIKIGALCCAVYAALHHTISIAIVYLVVSYTASVAQNLWNMNGVMRSYNRVFGDSLPMTRILNTPTTLIDHSTRALRVRCGEITLDHVTFTHDEGDGATLFRDFSLHIKPGEKVGLVGLSGSGKTTLTKLLLRFADIDAGRIMIDGQNIADVAQASLRSAIAYVPQEPLLFHRSVRENISYGQSSRTSLARITEAAKAAGALAFITGLKDGFNTMVGERGVKLSGGQRQRIAIARAILKDAPILILDEATSALDSESEKLIQQSLGALMKGRTSIVVAHRLSTIAQLDRIIVLDHGRIVEDGTHHQLLKTGGEYARLWRYQSGGFIDE